MTRLGPLVLYTRGCLDQLRQDDAKNLRYTSIAPTKKHEEELRRQAFAALKASKDDFVVLLGDRVENYKRQHRDTEDKHEEPGPDSAAYRPYVAHGGAPAEPQQLSRRFRFPPGLEAEKRRRQQQRREEQQASRSGRLEDKQLSFSLRPGGSPKHGSGTPQVPSHDEGFYARADVQLDLLLLNPAKALALRKKGSRAAMTTEVIGSPRNAEAPAGSSAKRKPRIISDVFQEFNFPKAELRESRRRVDLAAKGATLLSALEPEKTMEGLFPPADLGPAEPVLLGQGTLSKRFFMTEGEAGEPGPLVRGDSGEFRRSVLSAKGRLGLAPYREGRVSFAESASSRDLTRSNQDLSDAASASGFTTPRDEEDAPPPSSCYRNHLVQHFDSLQSADVGRTTYWRVRFEHAKCAKQTELRDRLEARRESRGRAYASARHLAVVAQLGERRAERWTDCQQPFGAPRAGDVWTQRTAAMDRRDARVQRRAQLWRRVADYAEAIDDTAPSLQTFMEHLRQTLMETEDLGRPLLAKALDFFVQCPEAAAAPGVWAVLHSLRTELGLDAEDLADAAASHGVTVALERAGLSLDHLPPPLSPRRRPLP
eukprot:EG_transcript_6936